jgi:hypothetical protein
MKAKILVSTVFMFLTISNLFGQKMEEEKLVKEAISKFAKAADERDEKALDEVLDNSFRLALNQMFGGKDVSVIDKKGYLERIQEKKFGGDKREVTTEKVEIMNNNASARVTLKGTKFTLVTLLQLGKSSEGIWKIVNDMPSVL